MNLKKANRDIGELQPGTQEKINLVLKEIGDVIFITEGYRSQERQQYLYTLGRTNPGSIVTHTLKSNHTGRKAVDIAFRGKTLYPHGNDKRWGEVAKIFKKYGFNWGGDWTKRKDRPHFEDNGKPLGDITIFMLFYETLWNSNYKKIPKKERMFKDPESAAERLDKLPKDQAMREMIFLLADIVEKLGLQK